MLNNRNGLLTRTALAAAISTVLIQSATAQEEKFVLEEVIVTAQKRTQSLQEVPIAISVFSGAAIEETALRELKDVSDYIPNLTISQDNDNSARVIMRGVGASSRNIGFDARVGVYIDGVYLGQSPALNQVLLDLERVEVLRGPQGTLFGKNTVAGAINMISEKPGTEFGGRVTADFGNLNSQQFTGMVNIPIGDSSGLRVSATDVKRDGTVNNLYSGNKLNEQDAISGRVDFFTPVTDNLDLRLTADALSSKRNSFVGEPTTDTFGVFTIVEGAAGASASAPPPTLVPSSAYAPKRNEVNIDNEPTESRDIYGAAMTLNYETDDGAMLRSISAYRDTESHSIVDLDYSALDGASLDFNDRFKQLTQEFQYISPSDNDLTYVVGLYLYYQDADSSRKIIFGEDGIAARGVLTQNQDQLLDGTLDTTSIAFYVSGEYRLSESWVLGLGGRYTLEEKETDWDSIPSEAGGPFDPYDGTINESRSDNVFTPSISLSWEVNDDVTSYLRVASGFKSGGWNLDFLNSAQVEDGIDFDKETSINYEFGIKTSMLDNRLLINFAAFYTEFDDYQVNQFKQVGATTILQIENAAEVVTQGVELEATFHLTEAFSLHGTLGVLDAEFDSYPGGGSGGSDASGNKLPLAPDYTYTIGGVYEKAISDSGMVLRARLDYIYNDGFYTTSANEKTATALSFSTFPPTAAPTVEDIDANYIDSYALLNGRLAIETGFGLELAIWGRNILDEEYLANTSREFFGTRTQFYALERTYGAEITYRF